MSSDGTTVYNIWFLPHHTEVLGTFKHSHHDCHLSLNNLLMIVASLHDIVQYLCAYARLGNPASVRFGSAAGANNISADWGGPDGIGMLILVSTI